MPDLVRHLAALFGYHTFRPHQEAVIRAVLAGNDAFTVMPTGGGKSLCYQLPARLMPGVCVVVSPLISLMKDQVDAANANGLAAAAFNSACSGAEKNAAVRAMREGRLDLLYISPERLRVPDFLELLKQQRIAFFAVDEAHCISQWGHDFRPDYLELSSLVENFPGVPVAAFTATATHQVERDIIERLRLRNPLLTRASFNRPNLFYQVTPKSDLNRQLLDFVREHPDEAGIIYRTTRKSVEETTEFLQQRGLSATAYHAGLPDEERIRAQNAFREDECRLVVATIAFGMGIDKSNVRYVVHGDLPKNLEGYYQETGRAGRDGEPARCVLFWSRKDIAMLISFAEGIEDEEARETAKNQLYRMLDFTQKDGCRRKALLGYFGEELAEDNCGGCDICTGEAEREDATVSAQKLLSAMVRTQNRFGARHVIGIVRGKDTKRIREFGHTSLPTFGVGSDKDDDYWHRVMDALIAQGCAQVTDPRLPVPQITQAGWEILRGQRTCTIVRVAENVAKKQRERRERQRNEGASPLFFLLREKRAEIARENSVPPYVVFSDRTLREMAENMPDTPDGLLAVNGVGSHKLEVYGASFLQVISQWLADHPECKPKPVPSATVKPVPLKSVPSVSSSPPVPPACSDTVRDSGLLFDKGMTVAEVAEARGLTAHTIRKHLETLLRAGKRYSPFRFMTPLRLDYISSLFTACGTWSLGPVVELSLKNGEAGKEQAHKAPVSYDEAAIARMFLMDWDAPPAEDEDA